ncbi:protein NLP7-like [Rhododendron vialii]|uniref:protein NLP7-like n=1 Tax=Rhododendron vialii TaxID=182163 RepID=UPI00265E928E|nr:protein NLP7-like [Rhododendron vialii]
MICHPSLDSSLAFSLIQFWAATKTSERRTLLTSQNQPFALGTTYYYSKTSRHLLCEYRMTMCREYNNYFYADAESGEEQLGLPGRVFLHKFPESAPRVMHYSLKEYPQLDLALRCKINGSWALPVLERSSQTYVGVLELVSASYAYLGSDKSFMDHLDDIFQEFGLQCSNGYKHYEMQCRDEHKALTAAIRELKMVLRSVCKVHELPLAMTWVPCSACNGLVRGQLMSKGVEFRGNRNGACKYAELEFLKVSKCSHFRNGRVIGWALSSPNMLYCSDITQISLAVYPLAPYARRCEFHGWFAIGLQSSYTAKNIYVLEFFLPTSYRYVDNSWTSLGFILRTMEEKFKTFKLASGQEFGDLLSVEVMDFQNGQKLHSVQLIQATRFSPSLEPLKDGGVMLQLGQLDQPSMDAINNGMNVVGEEQNSTLPSLVHLQNGEVTMQLDSSHRPSVQLIQATIFSPSLEPLKDGGVMLQLGQLDQPSMDGIHSGMNVVGEEQNCILPSLEPLQNGEATMQLDSSDQLSMDSSNNGQNVVITAKQNSIVVSSSEEGKRKKQEREHNKTGVRIQVSLEDIFKCSKMSRNNAARKLEVSISTLKRVCRGYGIHRWPPRNIKKVHSFRPLPVENQGQTPQLSSDLPSNQASASVAHIKPAFEDIDMVTIRAKYDNNTIKFRLSLSSTLVELQQEVAKRLNLKASTYYFKYKDEEDVLILIACDEDLQDCILTSRSLGNTSLVVQLEPKQPITPLITSFNTAN